MIRGSRRLLLGALLVTLAVSQPVPSVATHEAWIDELAAAVLSYRMQYPKGNWAPYMQQLEMIQNRARQQDQERVTAALDALLAMLRHGAYGIDSRAAHALYWITLGFRPPHS